MHMGITQITIVQQKMRIFTQIMQVMQKINERLKRLAFWPSLPLKKYILGIFVSGEMVAQKP